MWISNYVIDLNPLPKVPLVPASNQQAQDEQSPEVLIETEGSLGGTSHEQTLQGRWCGPISRHSLNIIGYECSP